ncbi:MAG: PTS sugar transporter subunit IIA [candidate division KSB1 bacterium]|nr:PTS sugar transporter subunit IIA [candidate division KSB1 bacterium]
MNISDLLSFLSEDRFIPELKAKTKSEALEELTDILVDANLIRNKHLILEMLHRRESVGSTGIGHGIAIPHGRTTAAPELIIVFGRSSSGIAWEAIDGKPVHLIFLVIAPPHEEDNQYLPMLGKLVEFLHDENNRNKLLEIKTFQEFEELIKA